MESYVVDIIQDSNKFRVIHKYSCVNVPAREHRLILGKFDTPQDALKSAYANYSQLSLKFRLCPLCTASEGGSADGH
ncbi:hypothetical protein [Listeria fleischmannii]|uniref:hypothetical protein n=1 Tax=Listeria fleischmannii TaxID=1069827 RepID=UPI0016291F46|nr:hypothetical protein [Listeria fleischmannii]MBC1419410.1 hypothetical protein [Listeria fleischmannii]